MPSHPGTTRRALLAATSAIAAAVLLTSCANFSETDQAADQGTFSPVPSMQRAPQLPPPPPENPGGGPPPTGPCVDPNPAVIATCLDSTSGLRPGDSEGRTTYVAERTTGKIILSKRYGPQRVVATVPEVDASGDGGLIDFEMSPTYMQDQMIYAMVTTGSDNRIVRIAPTGSVKPVLTGIPKGATGNMGSISFASPTELIVATGDADNPGAAKDPSSLAGKIFSIDPNIPDPKPEIRASGLGSNVALCPSSGADGQLFVADSGAAGDRLSLVGPKGLQTLWTFADRPGVSGCAVGDDWIAVSAAKARTLSTFIKPTGGSLSVGQPDTLDYRKSYGAVGRMTTFGGTAFQMATVNKTTPGTDVKSFDDRVAITLPSPAESRA